MLWTLEAMGLGSVGVFISALVVWSVVEALRALRKGRSRGA
jgi:hypothetical protein